MERVRERPEGVVVGSWHCGVEAIPSWVSTLVQLSPNPNLIITVKPTTTTTEKYKIICKIKMNRVEDKIMTNFPYDIQMTAMFIFITLYLVMDIIF